MWRCTDDNFSPLDMLKAAEHVNHQKTTAQILTQNHKNELVDLFGWYGSKSGIIICDMWFWSVKTSICFKSEMHQQHYLSDNKLLMISNMWHITEINCSVSQFWHRYTSFSQCSEKLLTVYLILGCLSSWSLTACFKGLCYKPNLCRQIAPI